LKRPPRVCVDQRSWYLLTLSPQLLQLCRHHKHRRVPCWSWTCRWRDIQTEYSSY
jgi:hypothetical protein